MSKAHSSVSINSQSVTYFNETSSREMYTKKPIQTRLPSNVLVVETCKTVVFSCSHCGPYNILCSTKRTACNEKIPTVRAGRKGHIVTDTGNIEQSTNVFIQEDTPQTPCSITVSQSMNGF
jgi:hypothetical protein